MKRIMAATVLVVLSLQMTFAQEGYEKNSFTASSGCTLLYRSLKPLNQKDGKKYPLVLFLHGAGERGNDNEKQLTHGSQQFLNPVNRTEHPAFILFPQCPENKFWSYNEDPDYRNGLLPENPEPSQIATALKELIDEYVASGNVDSKRIYIMGLSMGGMATYDLVLRYPDLFAAAVPICGAVNVDRITEKPKTKFYIFHGDSDSAVPVGCSRSAYLKLTEKGAKPRYKEYPGCDHGSWNPAFNEPDLMTWLFKQHR